MNHDVLNADELLVAELYRRGVRHLARLLDEEFTPPTPVELLTGLAQSPTARVRNALILLFLRCPELHTVVPSALAQLPSSAANTLRLYYQAAVYLQADLRADLQTYLPHWTPLPDLFSTELQLPAAGSVPTELALQQLGARHQELSGWAYNWSGSYRQHIPLFLRQLKVMDYAHA